MDEQTYLELGETISQLTETCLERHFGETSRLVVPHPGSESAATFPWQEPANELPWYWAYFPDLDGPEKQKESALHAGYVRVVDKLEADKVIAELKHDVAAWMDSYEVSRKTNDRTESELHHQKYRRCLAMAQEWRNYAAFCGLQSHCHNHRGFGKTADKYSWKENHAWKCMKRYKELAEQFKGHP